VIAGFKKNKIVATMSFAQIFGVISNFVGYVEHHMTNIITKTPSQCVLDFLQLIQKIISRKIKG
jgi:hypothetical protein